MTENQETKKFKEICEKTGAFIIFIALVNEVKEGRYYPCRLCSGHSAHQVSERQMNNEALIALALHFSTVVAQ
jgi:hypothetical protein